MGPAALPDPLNLDVVALDPAPTLDANADPMRRAILACRRADARLAPGDAAGAREALEHPLLHRDRELQSAAHLSLEPTSPFEVL